MTQGFAARLIAAVISRRPLSTRLVRILDLEGLSGANGCRCHEPGGTAKQSIPFAVRRAQAAVALEDDKPISRAR